MLPETLILELIPYLLKKYDRHKLGVAIDVGVGTFNFYFEIFEKAGYKTFAVEPLPIESVKQMTSSKNVVLIEACLLDYDGSVNIYSGIFKDSECSDISSINRDWWGINGKSKVTTVKAVTFKKIIEIHNIKSISYLKIDTEGSEYSIIKQLPDFTRNLLPLIIEFEYGGGAIKNEKIAGWNTEYFQRTLSSISICHNLGYKFLLLFESTNELPLEFNMDDLANYSEIFQDKYVYGNIIMLKDKLYSLEKILNKKGNTLLQKIANKFL